MNTDSEPKKKNSNSDDIPWHPAFFDAIRMELDDYADDLQFVSEYPLNTEPLRIDVLIIKKVRGVALKKNIAAIFRRDNIVEYKSPTDYVSVRDFHKVCGYARIYAAIEEDADITDMTVTFVESHHPRDLIAHLREACGYAVEEKWPGVYIVSGDLLPIQIIDNRKLSADENLWLKGLDNTLGVQEWRRVMTEISRHGKSNRIGAYLDAIMRANKKSLREAYEMSDDTLTLDQIFEEVGLTARVEAKVEAKILGLFKQGYTVEEVERMLAQKEARSTEIPLNSPR